MPPNAQNIGGVDAGGSRRQGTLRRRQGVGSAHWQAYIVVAARVRHS